MNQNENNSYQEQEFKFSNISNQTLFCVLSYISIFWIVGLLVSKEDKTIRFHANQGIILSVILAFSLFIIKCLSDILYVIAPILTIFSAFLEVLWLTFSLIFTIIGIKNALTHKQIPLPIFGSLFTFIK